MIKLLFSASVMTLSVMGINFLFKIYLSYHIPKVDLGKFYTFMDVISLGIMLFSGYKDSLVKAFDEEGFSKVLFWYLLSFWISAFVVLTLQVSYYNTLEFHYPRFFLIVVFLLNALTVFLSYLNAAYKAYRVMLFETLVMSVGLAAGYAFFSFFLDGITSLWYAFLVSFAARIVYLLLRSPMRLRFTIASVDEKVKNFFKNTALSSLMYFFSGLFISVSSVVILKLFGDTHFLAEYQVVVKSVFFSLVAVLVYPLNSFAFPHLSQLAAQKNREEIVRIEKKLLLYLGGLLAMLSAATFLTRPVIELVFPQEYAGSYRYLNVLLPFLVFLAYTTFALNILKGFNRFDLALYVRMSGCGMFFVALGTMYITGFGAEAVLYAMDTAFVCMALLAFYLKRRLL